MMPDLSTYLPLRQKQLDWFRRQGVPVTALFRSVDTGNPSAVMIAHGIKTPSGRFDDDPAGPAWFVFEERDDVVYWNPVGNQLATFNGRAFALGEDAVSNPGTYAFDDRLGLLTLHACPLDWLRAKRDGCVIVDWSRAWSRLHEAPRIGLSESLVHTYRRHMRPPAGPEVFVLALAQDERRAA